VKNCLHITSLMKSSRFYTLKVYL